MNRRPRRGMVAFTAATLLSAAGCAGVTTAPTTVTVTAPAPTGSTLAAAPPGDWSQVVRKVQHAVVRLDVLTCRDRWMGSAFVVGPDLLLTAAHVVDAAATVQAQLGTTVVPAQVVAIDTRNDSALVKVLRPLPSTPALELVDSQPEKGSAVGILGYPLQTYELRVTQGIISGLDESVNYGTVSAEHAYITDAAINGGNSGGPVVDRMGRVIGLVSGSRVSVNGTTAIADRVERVGYVVPARFLVANLARWRALAPAPPARCQGDEAPPADGQLLTVTVAASDPSATDIARSLEVHGRSINEGRYEAAWQVFTPAMRESLASLDRWKQGLSSSFWVEAELVSVSGSAASKVARLRLRTQQNSEDGYQGQTCSVFLNDYAMVESNGGWQIDGVSYPQGKQRPCPS
ncbi:MAG: trypsin-like peptidase domain-containing protein [Austwickia sp.]|nr:trypsin-like peptidase domain-containing protein [Austwickia sp.]MBK8437228.1 trypsin-like peptidase domain-containing protein [Austwickia sp.]MBK9102462.1 trypsin-like peptidase domain-containing protein [Austwickia sp.]